MTLKENIKISDGNNSADVGTVLEQAGIDVTGKSFPQGLETMLSREFHVDYHLKEGVDLSGGQWQRVALARGLYRLHNVVVLDEPTAASDPLEESRIYSQFVEISKGKTAIIVTHRLGSTKIADRVIVMDKGKIVESGSHGELLQNNGVYAEMYKSQAYWYENI
jgi:ATP-binding cassette subfamily B protein